MKTIGACFLLLVIAIAPDSYSQKVASGANAGWVPISYGFSYPDYVADQQTGIYESDIVGNASNPAVYTCFDNWNTSSLTDGTLYFRIRTGGDGGPAGYSAAAFVGIDANWDGKVEAFVGVDNSGSADHIAIWEAGTGLNMSPSTTSIESPAAVSFVETSANYSWRAVSTATDGLTNVDLDGGHVDQFLSWAIPFSSLVYFYDTTYGLTIDENSLGRYIFGTATQDNSLNQDLGGVDGGVNSTATWSDLRAISDPITFASVVPEPSGALLVIASSLLLFARRSRR